MCGCESQIEEAIQKRPFPNLGPWTSAKEFQLDVEFVAECWFQAWQRPLSEDCAPQDEHFRAGDSLEVFLERSKQRSGGFIAPIDSLTIAELERLGFEFQIPATAKTANRVAMVIHSRLLGLRSRGKDTSHSEILPDRMSPFNPVAAINSQTQQDQWSAGKFILQATSGGCPKPSRTTPALVASAASAWLGSPMLLVRELQAFRACLSNHVSIHSIGSPNQTVRVFPRHATNVMAGTERLELILWASQFTKITRGMRFEVPAIPNVSSFDVPYDWATLFCNPPENPSDETVQLFNDASPLNSEAEKILEWAHVRASHLGESPKVPTVLDSVDARKRRDRTGSEGDDKPLYSDLEFDRVSAIIKACPTLDQRAIMRKLRDQPEGGFRPSKLTAILRELKK